MTKRPPLLALTCALALGWAGGSSHADGPAPAGAAPVGVSYSDVSARLAVQDAPLWLQLRIEADGRLGLRSALAAEPVAWTERGVWRFTGQPAEDMTALKALYASLVGVLAAAPRPAEIVEPDGNSGARLLVDVAAEVPWRQVQWVVGAACEHPAKIYRVTFLAPGAATWCDIDTPKDNGGRERPEEERVWLLEVKLFRKGLDPPDATPFTRLRVRVGEQLITDFGADMREPRPPPEPKVLTGGGGQGAERNDSDAMAEVITIDLPAASAPSGAHMAAWRRLSAHLTKGAGDLRIVGEIRTPPPSGGSVPAADVIEVMQRLRDAGCEDVQFEGTATPLPSRSGGGWDLGR